jgi:hypothetical protein
VSKSYKEKIKASNVSFVDLTKSIISWKDFSYKQKMAMKIGEQIIPIARMILQHLDELD